MAALPGGGVVGISPWAAIQQEVCFSRRGFFLWSTPVPPFRSKHFRRSADMLCMENTDDSVSSIE
jgi:hypothetical protein